MDKSPLKSFGGLFVSNPISILNSHNVLGQEVTTPKPINNSSERDELVPTIRKSVKLS
jgi:hypothetical protein